MKRTAAAFSPAGEMTNKKGKEMNPEPEATLKDCPATVEENRSLPFSKISPIWLAVDSMEAFKKFPQKPHFDPLCEFKEVQREGHAIGHMVTFSSLVDKALGLNCDHLRSSFHECLEELTYLECHGFDIKPIELHIKKMLSMKDQEDERLREKQVRNLEKRIKALSQENEKIDEEIAVLKSKRGDNEMAVERLKKTLERIRKKSGSGILS